MPTRGRLRPSSGLCLQFDAFSPTMRSRFLNLVMEKPEDKQFEQKTGFRSAFFRNTEMVKLGAAPIDVTYSLLFTGLECWRGKFLKPQGRQPLSYLLRAFLEPHGASRHTAQMNSSHGMKFFAYNEKESFMLMQAENHELVVWTGKGELEEAKTVFSRFHAAFQTVPQSAPNRDLKSDVVVFYLHHPTEDTVIESALVELKSYKPSSVVFYFPHHSSDFAFRIGKLAERSRFRETEWAFNMQHLRQLLRAKKIQFSADETLDEGGMELVRLRKRLGLIQDEMAEALGVTPRTLQNWEKGVGTSQLKRKIRDLVELTSLMDDYVSAPRETEWLSTPLAALQHKTPKELIASGRARDLIVEFLRLREGQPA